MSSVDLTRIRLRWPGTCAACGLPLSKGASAWHDAASRTLRCTDCTADDDAVAPDAPGSDSGSDASVPEPADCETPGAGARGRYEDLRDRREERARERFGRLGVAAVRLSGDPQHIKAWKTGAEGEERIARRLEKLVRNKGVVFLHDRRIPLSVANIDHIAIGPGGVTVIDAKNIKGKVAIERTGGLFGPRVTRLRIAGRDRTKLVEGLERQVAEVRAALTDAGHDEVDVAAALCFADPGGIPLWSTLRIRDVVVLGPRRTAKVAARVGRLSANEVAAIRDGLARRLPAG